MAIDLERLRAATDAARELCELLNGPLTRADLERAALVADRAATDIRWTFEAARRREVAAVSLFLFERRTTVGGGPLPAPHGYTCRGLKSGCCGNVHDTPDDAAACIAAAGFVDRMIVIRRAKQ